MPEKEEGAEEDAGKSPTNFSPRDTSYVMSVYFGRLFCCCCHCIAGHGDCSQPPRVKLLLGENCL
jgi:hypothetical protein